MRCYFWLATIPLAIFLGERCSLRYRAMDERRTDGMVYGLITNHSAPHQSGPRLEIFAPQLVSTSSFHESSFLCFVALPMRRRAGKRRSLASYAVGAVPA